MARLSEICELFKKPMSFNCVKPPSDTLVSYWNSQILSYTEWSRWSVIPNEIITVQLAGEFSHLFFVVMLRFTVQPFVFIFN